MKYKKIKKNNANHNICHVCLIDYRPNDIDIYKNLRKIIYI